MKGSGLSPEEANLSFLISRDKIVITASYVDDLLIFSSKNIRNRELKGYLLKNFKFRDMGNVSPILSINITRDGEKMKIIY